MKYDHGGTEHHAQTVVYTALPVGAVVVTDRNMFVKVAPYEWYSSKTLNRPSNSGVAWVSMNAGSGVQIS